jgi:hypothetical protein
MKSLLVCAVLLAFGQAALADAIVGETFVGKLTSYTPVAGVNVTATGVTNYSGNVGVFNWTFISGTSSYFDADPDTTLKVSTFHAFCIELNQTVSIGSSYLLTTTALKDAPKPGTGVVASGTGTGMGQNKADLITELYDRFYEGSVLTDGTGVEAAAFQLAIWNIIYDTTADRSVTSGAGTFYSNTSTTVSARANVMLAALGTQTLLNPVNRTWDLFAISNSSSQDHIVAVRIPPPTTSSIVPSPVAAGMGLIGFAMVGLRRQRYQA